MEELGVALSGKYVGAFYIFLNVYLHIILVGNQFDTQFLL